ncbi:MAG: branched-chain amino acid ABC transporter ATP-binding protein/permease [Leucobacter sp.]
MTVKMSYRKFVRTPFWILPIALAAVLLVLPFTGVSNGTLRIIVSIALLSMLVVGLNMTFGYAGELALGQSALYAVGAYFAGYLAIHQWDLSLTLIIGIIAAAAVGIITGIPGIRLGSWSLAMVTFFLVLLVPKVAQLIPEITGGAAGLSGIPLPVLFGQKLDSTGYYMLVIIVAAIFIALLRNFVTSRHGAALKVMRESPVLARSLGMALPRLKLAAYMVGALPAGAAGALFAYQDGYISPGSFAFTVAIAILASSIIGGSESIYGAIFGAAILTIGPLRTTGVQEYSLLLFGALLVLGGIFFTGGLAGFLNKVIRSRFVDDELLPDVEAALGAPLPLEKVNGQDLEITDLKKAFGGNQALGGVSLSAKAGQVTALIGPNGSGKTTLLNIVSGFYNPDSGVIKIGGNHVTGFKPHRLAVAGVSRTFQSPLVPKSMTVAECVASARYARRRTSILADMLYLPSARRARREDREEAIRLLSILGIVEHADRRAFDLSLGMRRILEVARALAGDPALILLDEPASGLDESEVETLSNVIRRVSAAGGTIVIVEHNFEMIMSIADQVNVLHLGSIIASGEPQSVRNDPDVVESYLGKAAREQLERELAGGDK